MLIAGMALGGIIIAPFFLVAVLITVLGAVNAMRVMSSIGAMGAVAMWMALPQVLIEVPLLGNVKPGPAALGACLFVFATSFVMRAIEQRDNGPSTR